MSTNLATQIPSHPQPATGTHSRRARANRANALHSTGPRTEAGKHQSARNALTHGLTSHSAVLPSEDPAAYQLHCRQFQDEYQPQTPTENQLVHQLADTAWRLNLVPLLEVDLLARATNPPSRSAAFDILDLYRALASLGMHGQRLSRQFQNTLDKLREIQTARSDREATDLKRAAAILELHKHKGIPYDPAQDGFVFSTTEIEAHSQHLQRLNESDHFMHIRFHAHPHGVRAFGGPEFQPR
jgi:hypothetical protein